MEFPELLPHRTHECNEVVLEPEKTSILFSPVCSQMQTKLDSVNKTHAEQAVETVEKAESVQRTRKTNDDMNMEHKGQDWKWMDRQKNQGYFPGIDFTFKIFEVCVQSKKKGICIVCIFISYKCIQIYQYSSFSQLW